MVEATGPAPKIIVIDPYGFVVDAPANVEVYRPNGQKLTRLMRGPSPLDIAAPLGAMVPAKPMPRYVERKQAPRGPRRGQ